jgi:hypothetical protein
MIEALAGIKARGWFWIGDVALGLLLVSVRGSLFVVPCCSLVLLGVCRRFYLGFLCFLFFGVPFVYTPGVLRSALRF